MTSNPVFTDRNIQRANAYLLCSRQEQKSLVTHHTLQSSVVRMCLACQHFDFNSADWISDNLHVISSRYLRTMGKEFIFQFSRRSWGRNAWRTPKKVCVGGYRVFSLTWPAYMQIYWNKRKRLHKKRVQLPQDWFGTPTWPPFHCFGTTIWPPWRHVKTLSLKSLSHRKRLPNLANASWLAWEFEPIRNREIGLHCTLP